jgi:hypothetical protein
LEFLFREKVGQNEEMIRANSFFSHGMSLRPLMTEALKRTSSCRQSVKYNLWKDELKQATKDTQTDEITAKMPGEASNLCASPITLGWWQQRSDDILIE